VIKGILMKAEWDKLKQVIEENGNYYRIYQESVVTEGAKVKLKAKADVYEYLLGLMNKLEEVPNGK
jgi:hypothetical protein